MKKEPHSSENNALLFGTYLRAFFPFFWKNFTHDKIFLGAGSLAFQTLLSIVPILAVILSILNVFEVFAPFKRSFEDFLVQNFMPGSGAVLHNYLSDFIGKTTGVPLVGGIFLFLIALSLISTVDTTLNEIWEVHAPRKGLQGFTLYWTVLTLGPVFVGSSLVASSYVWYTIFTEGPLLEFKTILLSYLPFFNSIVAFFLLYMLVPNRRVRFVHAFSGALLAAVLFEFSKQWFTFYVTQISTFEHIYGALSVIPMLFFWIYMGWVVVLTGAEFVFCLGALHPVNTELRQFNPLQSLSLTVSLLGQIWQGQKNGRLLNMKKMVKLNHGISPADVRKVVELLQQSNVLHSTAGGDLAISADLYSYTLYNLYTIIPQDLHVDANGTLISESNNVHLETISRDVIASLKSSMNMPLVALFEERNHYHS